MARCNRIVNVCAKAGARSNAAAAARRAIPIHYRLYTTDVTELLPESRFRSQHLPAGQPGIVTADAFQFAAKTGPVQRVEQRLYRRQIQVLAADRQVVALGDQRDEVEAEHAGRGAGGDRAVEIG